VNPLQMFIRGYKMAVSNLELSALPWLAIYLLTLLVLVPVLGVSALLAATVAADSAWSDPDLGRWLTAVQAAINHWPAIAAGILALALWATAAAMVFLYLEGGILGVLARAHRAAPRDDFALRPRLGFSKPWRVFRLGELWAEILANGGRVTVLASLYSIPALAILALPTGGGMVGAYLIFKSPALWPAAVVGVIVSFLVAVPAYALLLMHYRCALLLMVLREERPREAMRRTTAVLKNHTWEVLGIFGLTLAASATLSLLAFLLGTPLTLLTLLPLAGLAFTLPRLLLALVHGLLHHLIWTTSMGALAPFCDAGET
jgi:hypothetical protein